MTKVLVRGLLAAMQFCVLTEFSTLSVAAQEVSGDGAAALASDAGWKSSVEWHGFGSWHYGRTDSNGYLGGVKGGEYGNFDAGLIVAAEPIENLAVRAQISGEQEGGGTSDFAVDYAFAEWRFSDALRLRVGKAKHPFGIYTEIFDIGTARPFLSLPQAFYGPVGLSDEAYLGVGLTGRRDFANGWSSTFDVYAGGVDLHLQPELLGAGEINSSEDIESLKDVLGARLAFTPPTPGLSIGTSAYTGREKSTARRHLNVAVHGEYLTDRLWLRSEIGRHEEQDEQTADAGYLEAAWFLTDDWQVAARFERVDTSLEQALTSAERRLIQHRDLALGLNRWFSRSLVLKLSVHEVAGNRFTMREDAALGSATPAPPDHKTRLIAVGAQFTF